MTTTWPPEKLEQFLPSLLRRRGGWFANQALRRTRHGVSVCNRSVPWAGSLSLGRWRERRSGRRGGAGACGGVLGLDGAGRAQYVGLHGVCASIIHCGVGRESHRRWLGAARAAQPTHPVWGSRHRCSPKREPYCLGDFRFYATTRQL